MSLPQLCRQFSPTQDVKQDLLDGGFIVYQDDFLKALGSNPDLEIILENQNYPFAHELGVYVPSTKDYWFTSNIFVREERKHLSITRCWKNSNGKFQSEELEIPGVVNPNGGTNYKDGILFCAQGDLENAGGLIYMEPRAPYSTTTILDRYHDKWFNSLNDVVIHSDGSIWFTDPNYGAELGIRPPAQLPNQVYRFDPASGVIRAVADGFGRPNGICFAPDEETLYITDTDAAHGDGTYDPTRAATIYAFDILVRHGSQFLANKRLFASIVGGFPDGIKCDINGNVYSGCGDGVHVWSPGGIMIGKIYLPHAQVGNFCFGPNGVVFLMNEHRVYRAKLDQATRGALLGI